MSRTSMGHTPFEEGYAKALAGAPPTNGFSGDQAQAYQRGYGQGSEERVWNGTPVQLEARK